MAISTDAIKKQIISLLDANQRNSDGTRVYSAVSGDEGFIGAEIDAAIIYAVRDFMRAICETDGHANRGEFIVNFEVAHGAAVPKHYGSLGVPEITPFEGAEFTLTGVRKSVEEISSYRQNPVAAGLGRIYGDTIHNEADTDAGVDDPGTASSLAGFYSFVGNNFYFTGFSAVIPMARFADVDASKINDGFEGGILKRAFGYLRKDGTISNIFDGNWSESENDIASIRSGAESVPSFKPTIGTRDSGAK